MQIRHISLDLETWGTKPGSDIRSIGAVLFNPHERNGFPISEFYFACANPPVDKKGARLYDLKRDPATEAWWADQSAEAQGAFHDPIDLKDALERFHIWVALQTFDDGVPEELHKRTNLRVWSHGASFDPPIVDAALEACGLPAAWHYRAPRDTRTIFDAAVIDDHSAWLKVHPGRLRIPHHALDDAMSQARAISAAFDRIQVKGF